MAPRPQKGKTKVDGISADGARVVCTEFWADLEDGFGQILVTIRDGKTGNVIARKQFLGAMGADMSRDGRALVCYSDAGEGGYFGFFTLAGEVLNERWYWKLDSSTIRLDAGLGENRPYRE